MSDFIVRHPRTRMFLADKQGNLRYARGGFGNQYKWVRNIDEAKHYPCFADAELPPIFLKLQDAEICPVLSCGLAGDPIDRETAIANGTFHRRAA